MFLEGHYFKEVRDTLQRMANFESGSPKVKERRAKTKESLAYSSKVLNSFSYIDTEDYNE